MYSTTALACYGRSSKKQYQNQLIEKPISRTYKIKETQRDSKFNGQMANGKML